jgi:hypothetical protein
VSEIDKDVADPYEKSAALSFGPSKLATARRRMIRADKNESIDRIQDFRRVRLICKIEDSRRGRSENADRQDDVDRKGQTIKPSSVISTLSQDQIPVNTFLLGVPSTRKGISDAHMQDHDQVYPINCVCSYGNDAGRTVFCATCNTWQHILCYYQRRKIPDVHLCGDCDARQLEVKRATENWKGLREQGDSDEGRKSVPYRKPESEKTKEDQNEPETSTSSPIGTILGRESIGKRSLISRGHKPLITQNLLLATRRGATLQNEDPPSPRLDSKPYARGSSFGGSASFGLFGWWSCCACSQLNDPYLGIGRCWNCPHSGPCSHCIPR